MNPPKFFWSLMVLATVFYCAILSAAEEASSSLSGQIERALQSKQEASFLALSSPDSYGTLKQFFSDVSVFPYETVTVHQSGQDQNKLFLHVFFQSRGEAKFESWLVHTALKDNTVLIQDCEVINSLTGLFRLILRNGSIPVRNVEFTHIDTIFRLEKGNLFLIETGNDITGFVFLGEGEFEFHPEDQAEQQQIQLFSKHTEIKTRIQKLFVRSSPSLTRKLLGNLLLQTPAENPALDNRVREVSKEFDRNVYSVRLPFTDELWFTQLKENELYCEFNSDLGDLIYQHAPGELDDILLARRDKDQVISLYRSTGNRNVEMEDQDFEALSYKIRMYFNPVSSHISSVTEVRLKSYKETSTVPFRLNPDLRVSQIRGKDGSLIYFQEKKTNNLHIVMNEPLQEGEEFSLTFYYQGKIASERTRVETAFTMAQVEESAYVPPTYLFSNHSVWYPQLVSRPYSSGEITITVPDNYVAVTNGIRDSAEITEGKSTFVYHCDLPAKYFSLFVGRLDGYFRKDSIVPIDVFYLSLDKQAAIDFAESADKILRFYSGYFGDYPYKNLSLVLRPVIEAGGHAPATVAIVNRVFRFFQRKQGRDPLYIPEYPDFLLAHEIAHQWWGQTVGWLTYRDQWISEGFAQFAAWEYIRSQYGENAWIHLSETFHEWIEQKTYAGPIILGARLGHITEDPQAFSALLYNKGAFTLSMLKNWMGNENFSACLKEFYKEYLHQRVRIEDFKKVAQKYSTDDLAPFFQQWLFGWDIPKVHWSQKSGANESQVQFHFQQDPQRFYQMKIPVEGRSKDGKIVRLTAFLQEADQTVTLDFPFVPVSVLVDPQQEILMDR